VEWWVLVHGFEVSIVMPTQVGIHSHSPNKNIWILAGVYPALHTDGNDKLRHYLVVQFELELQPCEGCLLMAMQY